MKVQATRFFISAQFGNVDENQILDMSDRQASALMDAGLVKEFKFNVNKVVEQGEVSPVFIQPTSEMITPGSLSPAARASVKKTVKKSTTGGSKAKKGKSRS